ncbi:hypothetical protein B857_00583 [Solibacillus isronensis B3W22]|uniref:Uncharacterized protein n=1 Tax=Solibacillus isronensis B3W22 TaxID=1224748 RepID=K1L749_9BACL|nr:hypothetical protein [Solibacillus isronensis]EKB46373.1 hypothetical protein B857_00583 [Solibacillus isronensis B3W22]
MKKYIQIVNKTAYWIFEAEELPPAHTDAKINQYNDIQLLSYQAAVINRTF